MPLMIRERCIGNYSLNFISSILLIHISKWLFRHYPISAMTLTIFNCISSGLYATFALYILDKPSTTRPATSYGMLFSTSAIFATFLTLSNISLQYNTIGTYQVVKSFIPPILMIFEWIQLSAGWNFVTITRERFYRDYSLLVLCAFGLIITGTGLNLYFDFNLHPFGFLCAAISIFFNAVHQTLVQHESSTNIYERTRFLQLQSFLSGFLLIPFWPFLDSTFTYNRYVLYHWQSVGLLFLCGFLAFLLNLTVIWCIKDDGAPGYNMVGQLKSLFIIFLGCAVFRERLTLKQLISLLGSTAGCMMYIYVSYHKRERYKRQQQNQLNNIGIGGE